MKRVKLNGGPARGTGRPSEILFDKANEASSDNKGQEVSRIRMLENLKLALFFLPGAGPHGAGGAIKQK